LLLLCLLCLGLESQFSLPLDEHIQFFLLALKIPLEALQLGRIAWVLEVADQTRFEQLTILALPWVLLPVATPVATLSSALLVTSSS